ncbi:MAG: ABC transporter permease [Treponema sp.]|jgi:simple sugar transport system permease protein|nr:ABC transporter permease [Treponema sp.]
MRKKEIPASVLAVVLVLFISLFACVVLIFLLSRDPLKALAYFFLGPLMSRYYFGNMLNSAVPLILGGLGLTVSIGAGRLNLGGEGQVYAGAFTATAAALAFSHLGAAGAVLALAAGALLSGAAAGLSGFFRAKWGTNELITSFLFSNVLILAVNYLVTGPFKDPLTSLQSTEKIPEFFRLPRIFPPSNLSAAVFIALVLTLLTWVFFFRTRTGYEMRMSGCNEMFARYGGINTKKITTLAMFISGAFYGLAGGLEIFGTYYGTVKEFSSGVGWNGLAAALIAGYNPAALIPAAVFFAWIGQGARIAMQLSDLNVEIALTAESVIFFFVTSAALRGLFKRKGTTPWRR